MRKLTTVLVAATCLFAACKKEKQSTAVPAAKTTTSPIWKMNKTWQMDGYRNFRSHPSGGGGSTTNDTLSGLSKTITVIDDTTLQFKANSFGTSTSYDTLTFYNTDSTDKYIEYIPVVFKNINRYRNTYLKYYYDKDSISYYYQDYGVSFHEDIWLFSK